MTRHAQVRALAKINLGLRVLAKRPDGYHELRTVFQTISLADRIAISFTPARKSAIEIAGTPAIPDNLAERAALLLMEKLRVRGHVQIRLDKRIPMGAGLGGGSSDAAAVLLALPVLAGRPAPLAALCELGGELGSDVPFFLLGGTAVGIGRGSELFPLPDRPSQPGLLVTPGVHVSTPEAYRRLSSRLSAADDKVLQFQSQAWDGRGPYINDFESVVFEQHPQLAAIRKRLERAGASPARMTGSGSALFGLFPDRTARDRAADAFPAESTLRFSMVTRSRYRAMWWRDLQPHLQGKEWPPRPA